MAESHPDKPISLAQALAIIADSYVPVTNIETVALGDAHGRILANDIVAPIAVPAADNSAVDGYAFRHADLVSAQTKLRVAGIAAAGHPYLQDVTAGEAVRIFTGAVIPPGADTVAAQEDVSVAGASVTVPGGLRLGENRRLAGEDIAKGARIRSMGERLGPAEIGVLASVGRLRFQSYVGDGSGQNVEIVDQSGSEKGKPQLNTTGAKLIVRLCRRD